MQMGKDMIPSDKGLLFRKTDKKHTGGAYYFTANCKGCQKDLFVVKSDIKNHTGHCRSCHCNNIRQRKKPAKIDKFLYTSKNIWIRTDQKQGTTGYLYKSNCSECKTEIKTRKSRVKNSSGLCVSCNGKITIRGASSKKIHELQLKKKAEKERLKNIRLRKEAKIKTKTLGQRIIQFDNQRNNTVTEFNRIFKANLEGTIETVVIGKPFTDHGRFIYVDGVEYKQLFEVN